MTAVVLAPDKFKGSLTATEVARHLAAGLQRARPGVQVRQVPMADGGEGTVDAALAAGFAARAVHVHGPRGEPVEAHYALRGEEAVIEMALASGLAMTAADDDAARRSSSIGTGELIRDALDAGARQIVLGVGGSASTDGGAGLATALGVRLLGPDGTDLPGGGDALRRLESVDVTGLDPRLAEADVVLAADVDNVLLGSGGAAAVYGEQKGADAAARADLDAGLRTWSEALARAGVPDAAALAQAPGAGAAGGVGYGAITLLGAQRRPGIDVILDLTGFEAALAGAGLVITGEGSLDEQSLFGKTPVGVAAAAARAGVPTVAVAGRSTLRPEELAAHGITGRYLLTDIEPDVSVCISDAGRLLETLAGTIAADRLPRENG